MSHARRRLCSHATPGETLVLGSPPRGLVLGVRLHATHIFMVSGQIAGGFRLEDALA